MHDLAKMHLSGLGTEKNVETAQAWFKKLIMLLSPKKRARRKRIIYNTGSASCIPSATVWSRITIWRQNGIRKR